MTVTALLVSHEGARWLPAVLTGLRDQQLPPDRILAVDTGSGADTLGLLTEALGSDAVHSYDGSFPDAVRHALAMIDTEWVWILHDDANPEPRALLELVAAAETLDADIFGPKLREWPSLRRLLELGVTISATGRRETGLERGEYDQGQHDEVREMLAVNTAGMLVRREVLEKLGGFDPELPLFATDLDFGWRAARAGHRSLVVPQAVVFHAEAGHRGQRRTKLLGRRTRTHRAEREASLYVLLANHTGRRLPWQVIRLFFGSFVRMLGYLLVRSPGHAADELVALFNVYSRPGRIRAARRARRAAQQAEPVDVRRLLSPWWVPYRHGLDAISDLATAAANEGRDAAERRRSARMEAAAQAQGSLGAHSHSGRVSHSDDDDEAMAADSGLLVRIVTSPVAMLSILFVLVSLYAAREAFAPLAGGALSPAPASNADWWRLVTEGWHRIGQGTDAPEPGYVLPFALVASIPFFTPSAVVGVLFLFAVPVAALGAWRVGRVVSELGSGYAASPWLVGWATATYAVIPAASGAWGQGRFGVVASAALLPWLAHAALGFVEPSSDRRWRAGWRCGLLLAIITAFTPVAWLFVLLVILGVIGVGFGMAGQTMRSRSVWGPLAVVVAAPPVLLLPGTLGVLGHDVTAIFLEAGRLASTPGPVGLLAGRFDDLAAPVWMGLLLVVPAAVAVLRVRSRIAVVACWVLIALAAVLAAVLSRITITLPAAEARPGLGFLLLVIHGALVVAVLVGATGVRAELSASRLSWRQPLALVLAGCALLVPLGGWAWWLASGDDELGRPAADDVPAYMSQVTRSAPGHGVLLVRGDVESGLTWNVHRGEGTTLGQDEILALTEPDKQLDADVGQLVSRPTPEVVARMSEHGVDYVVMPAPVDPQVAATLDAASGMTQASAADRSTRAWQFDEAAPDDAIDGEGPWWHPWLLGLQGLAILVIVVLCGPTRRDQR